MKCWSLAIINACFLAYNCVHRTHNSRSFWGLDSTINVANTGGDTDTSHFILANGTKLAYHVDSKN
jgi:hypothetical protein